MRKVPDCSTMYHESHRSTAALPLVVVVVCSRLYLNQQCSRFVDVCFGAFRLRSGVHVMRSLECELVVKVLASG